MVVDGIEFVPAPTADAARVFRSTYRVRLADVTPRNRLRLDAVARVLQDVSSDDTADAETADETVDADIAAGVEHRNGVWVLRRLALRVGRLPGYRNDLEVRTWCSGVGRCWAERRTELRAAEGSVVDAAALWVCTDPVTGAPMAPGSVFESVFAPAASGRRVGSRLERREPPANAATSHWAVRASDFDVLGHVNNASYWHPVEAALEADPRHIGAACIEFRGGIDPGEDVVVATADRGTRLDQWWLVDGSVRAAIAVGFER